MAANKGLCHYLLGAEQNHFFACLFCSLSLTANCCSTLSMPFFIVLEYWLAFARQLRSLRIIKPYFGRIYVCVCPANLSHCWCEAKQPARYTFQEGILRLCAIAFHHFVVDDRIVCSLYSSCETNNNKKKPTNKPATRGMLIPNVA